MSDNNSNQHESQTLPEGLFDLKSRLMEKIELAKSQPDLEQVNGSIFGKKGEITQKLKTLGQMDADKRKEFGQALNVIKTELLDLFKAKQDEINEIKLQEKLRTEFIDVSLPIRLQEKGTIHPISHVIDELLSIMATLGFQSVVGPSIETDWMNFGALNIAPSHPARQDHDTFYMSNQDDEGNRYVLRTHTSPAQIRSLMERSLPMRIVSPGRVYRHDLDATHLPMFHQLEGMAIGEDINMSNLKWTLRELLCRFFELEDVPLRFRASYFPFTEPSMEVDIAYSIKDGQIVIGDGDKWLEVLGSGMTNPKVLQNCDIDTQRYQGFAFGVGVERLAMLKYGITDIRIFNQSNIRWLKHFGFSILQQPNLTGAK